MKKFFKVIVILIITLIYYVPAGAYTFLEDGIGDFTIRNIALPASLPSIWNWDEKYGATASGYTNQNLNTEAYLISPEMIILESTATFEHALNYLKGNERSDYCNVEIWEKETNKWTTANVSSWPGGNNWNFKKSEINLSEYVGKTIKIGFHYKSTTVAAPTWEVKNLNVSCDTRPKVFSLNGLIYSLFDVQQGIVSVIGVEEGFVCEDGKLIIPSTVEYDGSIWEVGHIAKNAFQECKWIENVVLPNTLTSIEDYAFDECYNLKSLIIPPSVIYVGEMSFRLCFGLIKIAFPSDLDGPAYGSDIKYDRDDVLILENGLVYSQNKTKLYYVPLDFEGTMEIPASVQEIEASAFEGCSNLTSVKIPDSVSYIGERAFQECSSLTAVNIPDLVTSIGQNTFQGCTGLKSVHISDLVTSIGEYAFQGCSNLAIVNIPDLVTSIGISAFKDCSSITSIKIPDKLRRIPNSAFEGCLSLTHLEIGKSVDSFGISCFKDCPIEILKINSETIGTTCFSGADSLKELIIGGSVIDIKAGTFSACGNLKILTVDEDNPSYVSIDNVMFTKNLESLICFPAGIGGAFKVPDTVLYIGAYAFAGCAGLTNLELPESIIAIGERAFAGCTGLSILEIPASVTNIDFNAFGGKSAISLKINCPTIKQSWFSNIESLKELIIGSSVSYIEPGAFNGCSSLESVIVEQGNSSYVSLDNVLYTKNLESLISYPAGIEGDFKIPEGVIYIDRYAFCECLLLSGISIPNSVISIGDYAFCDCQLLPSISIPNSVISIGDYAFLGCYQLTDLVIGNSVTSIGSGAFEACPNLTCVHIPNSVITIGDYAFDGCYNVTDLIIGNSVTSIGDYAFQDVNLDSLVIPNSVISIGAYAFNNTHIKKLEIGSSVTFFGEKAFQYCPIETLMLDCTGVPSNYFDSKNIKELGIGNSIEYIEESAFIEYNNLTTLYLGENIKKIGDKAFNTCYSLRSITVAAQVPPEATGAFHKTTCSIYTKLFVPRSSINLYTTTPPWSSFYIMSIEESGIETSSFNTPEKLHDIYSINGYMIKKGATQNDINDLKPGIYIIDGKKVMIK